MKKSTVLIIFIIYLASIVAIGFFGMSLKVYDAVKYVKSIEVTAESDSPDKISIVPTPEDKGKGPGFDKKGNHTYNLTVNFDKATVGQFTRKSGITEDRLYIALNIIPYITYFSGDVANPEEESITFSLLNQTYLDKEYVSFDERGTLICFKPNISFTITINPEKSGAIGAGAIVYVFV